MRVRKKDKWHDYLSAYDYTANLGRDRWAWEWLRRIPDYRQAAFASPMENISTIKLSNGINIRKLRVDQPGSEKYGLAYFPNPDLNALAADVVWSRKTHPRPVCVQVGVGEEGVVDEMIQRSIRSCQITHFTDAQGHEHLLLRGAGCVLQVRVEGLSLVSNEPRAIKLVLNNICDLERYYQLLKRAARIYGEDTGPHWSQRALQYRNALICTDASDAGLSKWQMAEIIYGPERVAEEVKSGGRALTDAMRRYCNKGEQMRAGDYIKLLDSLPE